MARSRRSQAVRPNAAAGCCPAHQIPKANLGTDATHKSVGKCDVVVESDALADQLIDGVAHVLTQWVEDQSAILKLDESPNSNLYSVSPPKISIRDYLKRMNRFLHCSEQCFVMALVYIKRIPRDSEIAVCKRSYHRLMFSATMIAAKVHDDDLFSSTHYAKVAGVTVQQLNAMEIEFMKLLDWRTIVDPKHYDIYHGIVCQAANAVQSKTFPLEEPEPEPCNHA